MASTYVNDLRLNELGTGDAAGTWGTITNTNLELIGEGLSYATEDCFTSDADATATVADGATDPARAMYFKVTSSATLTATRTLTIAPNDMSRLQYIENATTGGQSINISQGSGSNVTIPSGQTKAVYMDGAGSGAAVTDAFSLLNLNLADNVKLNFGAGSDLQIYHSGSHSVIKDAGDGNLQLIANDFQLRNGADNANMMTGANGGAITLMHNGSSKIATTATGVDVTGVITTDGMTTSADINFGDDNKAIFGAGSDLEIHHNSTSGNSFIRDVGAGMLIIGSDGTGILLQKTDGETMGQFLTDGAVELYHNNEKKIETTSTGIQVTGTALATTDTDTTNTGSVTLDFQANQNFVLTLTGNVTLANPTTEQVGQSGFITFIQDATGGRTVSLGTDYETAGGAGLTLSSTASATDVVPYIVVASGRILLGTPQLAFS